MLQLTLNRCARILSFDGDWACIRRSVRTVAVVHDANDMVQALVFAIQPFNTQNTITCHTMPDAYLVMLMQELSWHVRAPDCQAFMSSGTVADSSVFIHQIAICIVLDHELGCIPPESTC